MTRRRLHPPTSSESAWLRRVGARLRAAREARGLSERAAATLARVSRGQVTRIEDGEPSDLLTVARLAGTVGETVDVGGGHG